MENPRQELKEYVENKLKEVSGCYPAHCAVEDILNFMNNQEFKACLEMLRCPTCGQGLNLYYSKEDPSKFYLCLNCDFKHEE